MPYKFFRLLSSNSISSCIRTYPRADPEGLLERNFSDFWSDSFFSDLKKTNSVKKSPQNTLFWEDVAPRFDPSTISQFASYEAVVWMCTQVIKKIKRHSSRLSWRETSLKNGKKRAKFIKL